MTKVCLVCRGTGIQEKPSEHTHTPQMIAYHCKACGGTGKEVEDFCEECQGKCFGHGDF